MSQYAEQLYACLVLHKWIVTVSLMGKVSAYMFVRFIYIQKDTLLEKKEVNPVFAYLPVSWPGHSASLPIFALPGAVLSGDASCEEEAYVQLCHSYWSSVLSSVNRVFILHGFHRNKHNGSTK